MKKKYILIFLILSLPCCGNVANLTSQTQNSNKDLSSEMTRIGVETVMIFNSQAIDEYPLWSPDSNFIAANIEGEWYKFKLKNIHLSEAEWRKQKIGVLVGNNSFLPLTQSEQEDFRKTLNYNSRSIYTKTGDKIELKLGGFSTSLILTKNNHKPITVWKSGLENCHSLSISPDDKYVAYLCELNGLFVMKIK